MRCESDADAALQAAGSTQDGALAARIHLMRGRARWADDDPEGAVDAWTTGLATLGQSHAALRAQLMGAMAQGRILADRPEAERLLDASRTDIRGVTDLTDLAWSLTERCEVAYRLGRPSQAHTLLFELEALLETTDLTAEAPLTRRVADLRATLET